MPKFKKVSADEARSQRKDHVREKDGAAIMIKAAKAPTSWNADSRSARFVMSSESLDRYGDIVVQSGLDTKNFMVNPTGLLFHNSRSWPCGTWSDVTKVLNGRPRRTEGTLSFTPEGTDEDADRAARHVAAGTLRTVSIGFSPNWDAIEYILDDDEQRVIGLKFNESELLECSLCAIPANPDAIAKDAGGDWKLAREIIEEVLDTYAKTPEGLLLPLKEYEAAYKRTVEKIVSSNKNEASNIPSNEDIAEFAKGITNDDAITIDAEGAMIVKNGEVLKLEASGLSEKDIETLRNKLWAAIEAKDASDDDPDADDPDDGDDIMDEGKAKKDASWACKASSDLPIDEDSDWDGAGAKSRMLEAAGIGGDSPDHAKAAKGFLAVDTANPDLKGSYKLPFADIKGGELKALASGIRAAASRLPQTDIPDDVQKSARNVLDAYESKMNSDDKKSVIDAVSVSLNLDTEAATEKLNAFSKLIDTVATRLNKLFGSKDTIVDSEPVAPPTPEEFEAAKAKAAAIRERLATKGLI